MLLLTAAAFPVVIFLYVIYQKDHEKEPLSLLLKCLVGGCFSVIISLGFSFPLGLLVDFFPGAFLSSFHASFFEAAIPEEIAKFLVLYFLIWKSKELNHHYDGIVYAVFISLGFALVENILYVLDGGMEVAIARAVLSVPGHGLDAVLMGYYFSLARFHEGKKRWEFMTKSLLVPIIFHGGYDFILFYMEANESNGLLLLGLVIALAWLVIKLWRKGIYKIKKHLERDGRLFAEEKK